MKNRIDATGMKYIAYEFYGCVFKPSPWDYKLEYCIFLENTAWKFRFQWMFTSWYISRLRFLCESMACRL
jgi:hypothetical protein